MSALGLASSGQILRLSYSTLKMLRIMVNICYSYKLIADFHIFTSLALTLFDLRFQILLCCPWEIEPPAEYHFKDKLQFLMLLVHVESLVLNSPSPKWHC